MCGNIYFRDTREGVYTPRRRIGYVSSGAQNGEPKYIYI